MPKKLNVYIKESLEEIDEIFEAVDSRKRFIKRFLMLDSLRNQESEYLSDLALELNVERRTVSRWINTYSTKGIHALFNRKNKNNARKIISYEIESFIECWITEKLKNKESLSCSELIIVLHNSKNIKVPYHTLYRAMQRIDKKLEN